MMKSDWIRQRSFRANPFIRLGLSIAVVILVALLLSVFHYRLDLTAEKRYTLSDYSRQSLRDLDDEIRLNIYLDGDLNIPFHRMQQRLKETLEEFEMYAGSRLSYEFINPFEGKDAKATDEFLNTLVDKGLKPTNILDRDREGGTSEKLVIPGALMQYKDIEIPVNLLKNNPGSTAEENINSSIEAFEFELMRVVSAIVADTTEKVAFIEGHGEFSEFQVGDISRELGWNFQVDRGRIDGKPGILDQYRAVIIAGPSVAFNEQDKFVLDQYIMQGGKVLWFVDMINANLDSISKGNAALAMIRSLNIEDLLFRYGVRINPVLVQDIQCSMIPVNVALAGNSPDFRPAPWLYSPLLNAPGSNPITRNLNMIKSEFICSIDTIQARKGIKKTALLRTSQFSRQVAAPLIISLDEVRLTPREEEFNQPYLPVAILLEGKFESAFRNRMMSGLFPDTALAVYETSLATSIMVVADADVIRNDIRPTPQGVLITPLGYDRYSSQTYGNKEFIVNSVQYMTGHTGLIQLRSRELTIRLLDKTQIRNNRRKWVMINTILPPMIVIIAGLVYNWLRRRRYTGV
jgi:gliding-associated putative ABC transporter substrate-binding component GldG